ncbi:hypothetical protein Bca4012_010436 [Brassica carinata]
MVKTTRAEQDGVRGKAWSFSRGGEASWLSIAAEMDPRDSKDLPGKLGRGGENRLEVIGVVMWRGEARDRADDLSGFEYPGRSTRSG